MSRLGVKQALLTNRADETWSRKVFRAYDIRGAIQDLPIDFVRAIGYSLASSYRQQQQMQIVVGYDARVTSAAYAKTIADALQSSGLEVIFIGLVSTPVLYHAALRYTGNGVMITASHNPVSDNGIKWLIQGLPPTPEQIQQAALQIGQQVVCTGQGRIDYVDAIQPYLLDLSQDIRLSKALHISLEGLHGSAGNIALHALQNCGCRVTALHCQANGHFPLGAPDPSDPKRLSELKQAVLNHGSVMGVALDGDGDRLVILDELGNYVSPDRLLSLFCKLCLQQHPHREIVSDVKCSTMIANTVVKYRGKFKMIRTGSSFLRNYIATHQAVFGGEYSGHYVFNDGRGKGFDDGLYAALRLLEYIGQTELSLSQLLTEFPERIASADVYLLHTGVVFSELAELIKQHAEQIQVHCSDIDGIRLDFPYGFGIIRPSNTGEYFTLRFDADTVANFQHIKEIFISSIQQRYPAMAQTIATQVQPILKE